jgi:hypothetical protein
MKSEVENFLMDIAEEVLRARRLVIRHKKLHHIKK